MTRRLAGIVGEHLAIPLPHGDKKLVDRHGRVDGDLTTKEGLDVVFHEGFWCMLGEKWGESLDTHRCE